jgi:hypothetical protein
MSLQLSAPQPLLTEHFLDQFACGEADLDEWLRRRAMSNPLCGASRTFVVADQGKCIFAYDAMAVGAVAH